MSTKNLARTVIEGGRAPRNRVYRYLSNRVHRRGTRQLSTTLVHAVDYDGVVYPKREVVYPDFDDKLGPALRWLASQVGRPWNKARGELFERFDIRTTAGRHIVFDHLLFEVATERDRGYGWPRYRVDANGVLRTRKPQPPWRGWQRPAPLPEPRDAIQAWLAGRWVLARGEHLFWLEPTQAGFFRQGRALAPVDSERWLTLPQWFRDGERT